MDEEEKPESMKNRDEVRTKGDISITVPVVNVKCNWDDAIVSFFKKLFGGKSHERKDI